MHVIPNLETRLAHCRKGHFVYESGDHGDLRIDLDGLLSDARQVEAWSNQLANQLKCWSPEVVCGPQSGGARLAECVARQLGVRFVYSERGPSAAEPPVRYLIPAEMRARVHAHRVVVVDDAINAGSAVNATIRELESGGATIVAIGCLISLNEKAQALADARGLPLVSLLRLQHSLWRPSDCPICKIDTAPRDVR